MLITKNIITRVSGKTIRYYQSLGYALENKFIKIEIPIEHLIPTSHTKVTLLCDFCKKEFEQAYRVHIKNKTSLTKKDCCEKCIYEKNKEINILLYGVENPFQRKENQEKQRKTVLEKYGVTNISSIELSKQKKLETRRNRTDEDNLKTREKTERTVFEKYGVKSVLQLKKTRENLWLATSKASSQQIKIFEMLKPFYLEKIFLNYNESPFLLDMVIFIDDIKINIEYDSWYWHNKKTDRKRDEVLKSKGYKIFRIKSGKKIPELYDLKGKIEYLVLNKNAFYTHLILSDWDKDGYLIEENRRKNEFLYNTKK